MMGSQQYADLSNDSYKDHPVNDPKRDDIANVSGGIRYQVLEQVDSGLTGYQGTIYQRLDSGEIVVAHRGTEFDRQLVKDGLLADDAMVISRTSPQIADAIELTRRALQYARDQQDYWGHVPPSPSPATPLAAPWPRPAPITSTSRARPSMPTVRPAWAIGFPRAATRWSTM